MGDNMNKTKIYNLIQEYLIIVIGSLIYAFAFDWLFVPNNLVMGGFTGLAQIIHHYIPAIPIGSAVIALNIPLFAIGLKLQGPHLLFSSVFALLTSSVAIDIWPQFITFHPIDDHLMVSILGGAMVGGGLGFMLWVGATTGGTELAASLLKYKFRHIQIGRLCLLLDLCVIILYMIAFDAINDALYAGIAMFVSSRAMDSVVYGSRASKLALIICDNGQHMISELLKMDLGVTEIQAKGAFSRSDKYVLLCAFKPSRIAMLKQAVIMIDKHAFVIVVDAQEVYGEGFEAVKLNSL